MTTSLPRDKTDRDNDNTEYREEEEKEESNSTRDTEMPFSI